jgi:hypothetical protein
MGHEGLALCFANLFLDQPPSVAWSVAMTCARIRKRAPVLGRPSRAPAAAPPSRRSASRPREHLSSCAQVGGGGARARAPPRGRRPVVPGALALHATRPAPPAPATPPCTPPRPARPRRSASRCSPSGCSSPPPRASPTSARTSPTASSTATAATSPCSAPCGALTEIQATPCPVPRLLIRRSTLHASLRVLCYAMLCCAMLCYAMLCDAMLCYYAMLCYAILQVWAQRGAQGQGGARAPAQEVVRGMAGTQACRIDASCGALPQVRTDADEGRAQRAPPAVRAVQSRAPSERRARTLLAPHAQPADLASLRIRRCGRRRSSWRSFPSSCRSASSRPPSSASAGSSASGTLRPIEPVCRIATMFIIVRMSLQALPAQRALLPGQGGAGVGHPP